MLCQGLLEEEVLEELKSYGIEPDQQELSNEEYETAMADLENR